MQGVRYLQRTGCVKLSPFLQVVQGLRYVHSDQCFPSLWMNQYGRRKEEVYRKGKTVGRRRVWFAVGVKMVERKAQIV